MCSARCKTSLIVVVNVVGKCGICAVGEGELVDHACSEGGGDMVHSREGNGKAPGVS